MMWSSSLKCEKLVGDASSTEAVECVSVVLSLSSVHGSRKVVICAH